MKKRLLICLVFVLCTLGVPLVSANEVAKEINVVINGEVQKFDAVPVNVNGSVLVPMRAIFEMLQATITWDGSKQQVTATYGSQTIVLTINSKVAVIDGEEVELTAIPQIVNGNTLVPLRFVGEALDCDVKWNSTTNTVDINRYDSVIDDDTTDKEMTTQTTIVSDEDKIKELIQYYVDSVNTKDAKGFVSIFEKGYETEEQIKTYFKENDLTYTIVSLDNIKVNGNEASAILVRFTGRSEHPKEGPMYTSMRTKDTINVTFNKLNNVWKIRMIKETGKELLSVTEINELVHQLYYLQGDNFRFRNSEYESGVVSTLHPENPAYDEDLASQFAKETIKYEIVSFKLQESTNNDAKVEVVTLYKKEKDSDPKVFELIEKQTAIVEYKKTTDGWKIYGSETTKTETVSGTKPKS
jgi:hypothetical protein